MDERRTSPTRWRLALRAAVVGIVAWSSPAWAQVSVSAVNTDLLYSKDGNIDCSALSKITTDTALPRNVARLRVNPGATAGRNLRFEWSMKKSAQGTLAADLDIGAGQDNPSVAAMCADFGNACTLTSDRLKFYNEDTILWVAPTCAVLPSNTRKAFHGGKSRVQVKVFDGKHRIGKAHVDLHWGMNGSVTLFVRDLDDRFQDGVPKPFPVNTFADPIFAFDAVSPIPPPPGTMTADFSGGGGTMTNVPCPAQFDDCFQTHFPSAGRFLVLLTLFFEDGSALCDNITVHVVECNPAARLEVIPRPRRTIYDPAKPSQSDVDLTVRLTNTAKPKGGLPACPFRVQGANVLSCTSDLKLGTVKDQKTTRFDLQHCSMTTSQPCDSDAECSPAACLECEPNEVCLTKPHCSKSFDVQCGNDIDCAKQSKNCPNCEDNETCVRILEIGDRRQIFMDPGTSLELLHQPVTLTNLLGNTAVIKDKWTATVLVPPEFSVDDTLKYKIRGRPGAPPTP